MRLNLILIFIYISNLVLRNLWIDIQYSIKSFYDNIN